MDGKVTVEERATWHQDHLDIAKGKLTSEEFNSIVERAATVTLRNITADQGARAYVHDKGHLVLEHHK